MYTFKQLIGQRSRHYSVLLAFLMFAGLTGGGSRGDIASLALLRPFAAIVCGYALWTLNRETLTEYRVLLGLAVAVFVLTLLHLVPLPPALWQALPGRELIAQIDRSAGIAPVWRPLSLAPEATWNALFSLLVPMAVLLVGMQLARQERRALIGVVLAFGLLTAIFTMFQAAAPTNPLLYLYRFTNTGLLVGLFANRNHNAMMLACLLPLLAVYASSAGGGRFARLRPWPELLSGATLIVLILVVGSRAGAVIGVIALLSVVFLYRRPRESGSRGWLTRLRPNWARALIFGAGAAVLAGIVAIATIGSRAIALQRLGQGVEGDLRLYMWDLTAKTIVVYFPFGSGIGSFVEVYKVHEPQENLIKTYANHAHNDWLEVVMTSGLLGAALLAFAVGCWAVASWRAWRVMTPSSDEARYARAGSVVLLLLALMSVTDYPMRVPSIMCLAVISALWLRGDPRRSQAASDQAG